MMKPNVPFRPGACLMAVLWLASAAPAQAQLRAADVSVSIRSPLGYVGEELRAPVYVEGPDAKALRKLSLALRYPRELLSFVEVETGYLLRDHLVKVESRTVAEKEDTTALLLDLTFKDGVPEGLILYVKFQVAETAPLGVDIPVKTRAEGTVDKGSGPATVTLGFPEEPFRISPRKQEDEFQFACFFYMH